MLLETMGLASEDGAKKPRIAVVVTNFG